MTRPSTRNVVIVVVVITGDSGEDLASHGTAPARPAEARTRREHAEGSQSRYTPSAGHTG